MTDPIVFISRNRVKEGALENFKQHYQESIPVTETSKPGTFVQLAFINEAANEVVIVRLFPSTEGLDLQLQGADQRSKSVYQFIEPTRVEIYGTPSNYAKEMIGKVAGSGINVSIHPQFIGGFIRYQTIR